MAYKMATFSGIGHDFYCVCSEMITLVSDQMFVRAQIVERPSHVLYFSFHRFHSPIALLICVYKLIKLDHERMINGRLLCDFLNPLHSSRKRKVSSVKQEAQRITLCVLKRL